MRARTVLLVLVVCSLPLLAGCVGDQSDAADPPVDEEAPAADVDDAAPADDADAETSVQFSTEPTHDVDRTDDPPEETGDASDRQLIRTGTLELTVDDADEAESEIRSLTSERGGYIAGSEREVHTRENDSWVVAQFRLRVPAEEFDTTFEDLQTHGDVESASTDTEDVTEQLTDIEARLENLRAERDRLRDLFEDANETEDVLAVQSELSDVQEQIERLEAQQQSLQDRVAMATITVRIAEETPEPPSPEPEPAWYEVGVGEAFTTSIGLLGTTVRAAVVAAVYATPFALVLATPFALGAIAYRRRNG